MTKIVLLESTARGVVPQDAHKLIDGDIYFSRSKALAEIFIQNSTQKEVKLLTLHDAVIDFVSAGSMRIIGYYMHESKQPDRQVWQLHYNNIFSQQTQAAAKEKK